MERVWAAVTDPEQLRGWIAAGGAVLEPRVGGRFEVRMTPDEKETAWGTVLAFEPPRLLEVEWRYEGEDESVLRIELESRGEATLLVLDHRLLQARQAPDTGRAGTPTSTRSATSSPIGPSGTGTSASRRGSRTTGRRRRRPSRRRRAARRLRLARAAPLRPPRAPVVARSRSGRRRRQAHATGNTPPAAAPASYASHMSTKASVHGPSKRSSGFHRATARS